MTDREIIAAAYNAGVEEEYNRLVSNPFSEAEYELITELMKKYISNGSVVIDIGSGPGRYAEFLLKRNCKVGLVDLSEKSLDAFNNRISGELRNNVLFSEVACATRLSFIDDNIADAVFLMGPLYHLVNHEERAKAVAEALRIMKPGGYLFAVFMSTYNLNAFNKVHLNFSEPKKMFPSSSVTMVNFQGYQIPQYRCMPELAINAFDPKGFETLHIRNLEGPGIQIRKPAQSTNATVSSETIIKKLRATCENTETSGLADQFLYVGQKTI